MDGQRPLLQLSTLGEPPFSDGRIGLLHQLCDGGTRSQALAFILAQHCWTWCIAADEDPDSEAIDDCLGQALAMVRGDWGHIPQDAQAMRRLQEVCEDHLGRLSGRELCARLILEAKRHQRSLYHHHQQLAIHLTAALGDHANRQTLRLVDCGDGTQGSNADGPLHALDLGHGVVILDPRLGVAAKLCGTGPRWRCVGDGDTTPVDTFIICCEGADPYGCWLPRDCRSQLAAQNPQHCFICCLSSALSALPLTRQQHPDQCWEWGPWPPRATVVSDRGSTSVGNGTLTMGTWAINHDGRALL